MGDDRERSDQVTPPQRGRILGCLHWLIGKLEVALDELGTGFAHIGKFAVVATSALYDLTLLAYAIAVLIAAVSLIALELHR